MAPAVAHRLRSVLLLTLLGLWAGCGNDSVESPQATTDVKEAWIGSYADPSGHGDLVLDVTRSGSNAAGEIVFGSPNPTYLRVRGVQTSDSLVLGIDRPYTVDTSDFSIRARVLADGTLSGVLTLVSEGLSAGLSCRGLDRRDVQTQATHSVPYTVKGLVYDGTLLWLATVGDDYVRITPDGTVLDTIVIYHDPLPAHWTSDVLMFDGALIWGEYPITIGLPGGSINVADLLAFTAAGRTQDSIRVGHRPAGLAHDGTQAWSLRPDPNALIAFDRSGATTESLHVGIPDAIRLAFDGTRFWTLGWSLRRLYELDTSGQVLAMCDLPPPGQGTFATGLALEGSAIWYTEASIGGLTRLRKVTLP